MLAAATELAVAVTRSSSRHKAQLTCNDDEEDPHRKGEEDEKALAALPATSPAHPLVVLPF